MKVEWTQQPNLIRNKNHNSIILLELQCVDSKSGSEGAIQHFVFSLGRQKEFIMSTFIHRNGFIPFCIVRTKRIELQNREIFFKEVR